MPKRAGRDPAARASGPVKIPEAVLEAAKKETYRFHIEGFRLDGDRNRIDIDSIVEIGPDSPVWTADESEEGVLRWKMSETPYAPVPSMSR